MFTHYSARHTGYGWEYDASHPFFKEAFPIKHHKDYPQIELGAILSAGPELMSEFVNAVPDLVSLKAKQWSYENEWRLASHLSLPGADRASGSLKRVIVGTKMGAGELEEIKTLTERLKLPVYKAVLRSASFGLFGEELGPSGS